MGFDATERSKHDTWKLYTQVDKYNTFASEGKLVEVEFYAGSNSDRSWADGRPLKVSIYRPSGSECQFEVVSELKFKDIVKGYNKVLYQKSIEMFLVIFSIYGSSIIIMSHLA